MKITGVKSYPVSAGWRDWLFVKVETDEGIHGWGEATLLGYTNTVKGAIQDLVGNELLGKNPCDIELHFSTLFRNCWFRPSIVLLSAIGGVEMALWDIMGKSLGVPVYKLLGGACHKRIPLYSNTWYFNAKNIEDFGVLAAKAVEEGATHLKWDPFWGMDVYPDKSEIKRSKECVKIVREAVGNSAELLIEMHGRFSPDNAILIAKELEEFSPFWYEEPIPSQCSVKDLKRVAEATSVPIASGEKALTRWQYWDLLDSRVLGVAQPDITWCGGIAETKKIANMAEVFYTRVAPHSASGPGLALACFHLDACLPNLLIQEFFYPDLELYDELLLEPFARPVDGYMPLPDKPGLGFNVDEEAVKNRPYEPLPKPLHGGHFDKLRNYGNRK